MNHKIALVALEIAQGIDELAIIILCALYFTALVAGISVLHSFVAFIIILVILHFLLSTLVETYFPDDYIDLM